MPCSEEENLCAQDYAEQNAIWLGVTDRDVEGTFVGVEGTCSPVPASAEWWRSGEPNDLDGKDDCVTMDTDLQWFDNLCEDPLYALCQLRDYHLAQCDDY